MLDKVLKFLFCDKENEDKTAKAAREHSERMIESYKAYINVITPSDKMKVLTDCSENNRALAGREEIDAIYLKVFQENTSTTYSTVMVTFPKNTKENKKYLIQQLNNNNKGILSSELNDIVNTYNTIKE